MESKINKMLFSDCTILILILVVLWGMLAFVMVQVSAIISNHAIKTVTMAAGILVGTFSTAASAAVFFHLRKNRKELYLLELLGNETDN